MQAAVLVQPVPDLAQLSLSKSQERVFEKAPRQVNPADRVALEAALLLQDRNQVDVTTVCLAGVEDERLLRETLALGAKKAILLWDPRLAQADPFSRAQTIAAALRKLGVALVFAGPGQMGPRVSEEIKAVLYTDVTRVQLEGEKATVNGEPVTLPGVLCISGGTAPRMGNPIKIMKAAKAAIVRWDLEALGLENAPPEPGVVLRRSYLPAG